MNKFFFKYLFLLLAIILGLSSSSCKTKKGGEGSVKDKSAKFLLKKIEQDKIGAEWLNAKAKIDFKSDALSMGATAYIRMRKDSAIWIVGKKFGIEGVRVLITSDSVFMLDRINNEYRATDLTFIQQQFSLPVDFNDLQNILLGNLVLLPETKLLEVNVDKKQYHLSEKKPHGMSKNYWLNGSTYAPERMTFKEGMQNRDALIENSNHRIIEGTGLFSHNRYLEFQSPETGQVVLDMKFSRVELNVPVGMKFEVPRHYTRVD